MNTKTLEGQGQSRRVVILTPRPQDSESIRDLLHQAALDAYVALDIQAVCQGIAGKADTAVVADVALDHAARAVLVETLNQQPAWSDFPFVVLTTDYANDSFFADPMWASMNVVFAPWPIHAAAFLTTVSSALRVRARQCAMRNCLQNCSTDEAISHQRVVALNERVKELNTLYAISRLSVNEGGLGSYSKRVVDLIPPGFQFPEATAARLTVPGVEQQTINFKAAPHRIATPVRERGQTVGVLEVFYLEPEPPAGREVFLSEESNLLRAIADQVGRSVEQYRAEEALRRKMTAEEREHNKLRAVLEALPVGVFITDATGRIIEANAAGHALWGGAPLSAGPGRYSDDYKARWVATGKRIESHEWALARALSRGETSVAEEIEIETRDGDCKILLNYALPVRDGAQKIIGAVAVNVDITERKRNEQELARLATLVASSYDAIIGVSIDGRIMSWNVGAEHLYGYAQDEAVGQLLSIVVPARCTEELWKTLFRLKTGEHIEQYETVRLRKDGREIDIACTLSPIRNSDGTTVAASSVERDITERKRGDEIRARLAAIVESSPDAIIGKSVDGIISSWNTGATRMLGYTAEEVVGKPISIVVPDDRLGEEQEILRCVSRGERITQFETVRRRKDGQPVNISLAVAPLWDSRGRLFGVASIARDITERKRFEEQLQREAFYDRLTGLPNRALFMDRLQHAIARGQRLGEHYAVFVLDLDNFKIINDSYGHLAGDRLLYEFGQRINSCLRPVDTIARFGGDEFTILLEEMDDISMVEQVANRVLVALRDVFVIEQREIQVRSSIGITVGNSNYRHSDTVLRDADAALYQAKRRGKSCYVVFDRQIHEAAVSRHQMEAELRHALGRGELSVHYQPIVDLATDAIVGCEALARWYHIRYGALEPGEFIALAEDTGLIIQLGAHVLDTACRDIARWLAEESIARDFYVSVNVSSKQFFHGDMVARVGRMLRTYDLRGENLRLEITESVIMKQTQIAAKVLHDLRDLGVRICMDDFGTGYSSLSYLHQFPVDVLKVDQTFIQGLTQSSTTREIVRTILGLAKNLDMQSIAEGAESQQQLAEIKAMGFRWAQGFIFHRPVDKDSMSALLSHVRH